MTYNGNDDVKYAYKRGYKDGYADGKAATEAENAQCGVGSGPLPGNDVTVVQTADKTLFVREVAQ